MIISGYGDFAGGKTKKAKGEIPGYRRLGQDGQSFTLTEPTEVVVIAPNGAQASKLLPAGTHKCSSFLGRDLQRGASKACYVALATVVAPAPRPRADTYRLGRRRSSTPAPTPVAPSYPQEAAVLATQVATSQAATAQAKAAEEPTPANVQAAQQAVETAQAVQEQAATVIDPTTTTSSSFLPIILLGAGGFFIGGPIGAAAGALVGSRLAKKEGAAS